ncbi:MAG: hypothetical protein KBD50_02830 [Candidatus Pacebacteria bacterium]|nr:hypothetical protein [Candidatus Paceibacterota bacterium]
MIFNAHKTHLVPTLLLLAAAVIPLSPLATLGAYGDTETSSVNIMQASDDFTPRNQFKILLDEGGPEAVSFAAFTEGGEVAGTSTEPVVEVSEPIVETTIDEEEAETPSETPTEPVVEVGEPVVEITTPDTTEDTSEPEDADPQPEPTPQAEE